MFLQNIVLTNLIIKTLKAEKYNYNEKSYDD